MGLVIKKEKSLGLEQYVAYKDGIEIARGYSLIGIKFTLKKMMFPIKSIITYTFK